jgi:hypothetical protein
MGVFEFVIVVVLASVILGPLAKGIGTRIGRSGAPPDAGRIARLAAELEAAEQRLSDAERRLFLAEERLDFQEKLLTARASSPAEPRPAPDADS